MTDYATRDRILRGQVVRRAPGHQSPGPRPAVTLAIATGLIIGGAVLWGCAVLRGWL